MTSVETVAAPVTVSATTSETVEEKEVPISISPSDYVCFGTIDKSHPECQKCLNNKQCAEATK